MVHSHVHEKALGKTISGVYLGDTNPIASGDGGVFQGEYLGFEFTDGTLLVLEVAAGNSFSVAPEDEARKILAYAKRASKKPL